MTDRSVLPFGRDIAEMERNLARLKDGGGDGTSGGVEDRVARLEKQFDQMTKDVGDLRVDMATLKERVAHLPGKGFIVTATSTTIVLLVAAVTFADKLRALVGS